MSLMTERMASKHFFDCISSETFYDDYPPFAKDAVLPSPSYDSGQLTKLTSCFSFILLGDE